MGVSTRRGSTTSTDTTIPRVSLFRVNSVIESFDSPIDRRSQLYRDAARQRASSVVGQEERVSEKHHGAIDAVHDPLRRRHYIFTLPTVLTILRMICVPVLVMFWFLDHTHAPVVTASLFIIASITDWLDGFLARQLNLTSAFGAFLDPVADKVMVATVLVLLASEPPAPITRLQMVAPASTMIAREIAMSALREWAAASGGDAHKAVKVSTLGKWKTCFQMISLSLLLVLRNDHLVGDSEEVVLWLHRASISSWMFLTLSSFLAMWSLFRYVQKAWQYFIAAQPEMIYKESIKPVKKIA